MSVFSAAPFSQGFSSLFAGAQKHEWPKANKCFLHRQTNEKTPDENGSSGKKHEYCFKFIPHVIILKKKQTHGAYFSKFTL